MTDFSHMTGSLLSARRLGGKERKGEEDAFREYMGMQRKLRRQGLICEGLGIQDDPTELPASQWLLIPPGQLSTWPTPHLTCSHLACSHLACSHLAYSQVCWGSRKGPRQGHCCHSAHLAGWAFSNPLFLYSENKES